MKPWEGVVWPALGGRGGEVQELTGAEMDGGFPGGSVVKNLPANLREMQVPSLGGEDPLEEDMATHSSTLAWDIPWTEDPLRWMGRSYRGRRGGSEDGRSGKEGWCWVCGGPSALLCPHHSPGDPRRHQRLHRLLGRSLPGGAVSPAGEGSAGPGGHPLRLVPGPGLGQLCRRAAHRGHLPGGGPCA